MCRQVSLGSDACSNHTSIHSGLKRSSATAANARARNLLPWNLPVRSIPSHTTPAPPLARCSATASVVHAAASCGIAFEWGGRDVMLLEPGPDLVGIEHDPAADTIVRMRLARTNTPTVNGDRPLNVATCLNVNLFLIMRAALRVDH